MNYALICQNKHPRLESRMNKHLYSESRATPVARKGVMRTAGQAPNFPLQRFCKGEGSIEAKEFAPSENYGKSAFGERGIPGYLLSSNAFGISWSNRETKEEIPSKWWHRIAVPTKEKLRILVSDQKGAR
jgi:hypothetical protein